MLDTVKINHVQHISFTQSRLTDAVSVILSELLSYEHPSKAGGRFLYAHTGVRAAVRQIRSRVQKSHTRTNLAQYLLRYQDCKSARPEL